MMAESGLGRVASSLPDDFHRLIGLFLNQKIVQNDQPKVSASNVKLTGPINVTVPPGVMPSTRMS